MRDAEVDARVGQALRALQDANEQQHRLSFGHGWREDAHIAQLERLSEPRRRTEHRVSRAGAAFVAAAVAALIAAVALLPALFRDSQVGTVDVSRSITFISELNEFRAQEGCGPVRLDLKLEKAATDHAEWMAQTSTFSHTGRAGSSFTDRVSAQGFTSRSLGENIAAGQADPTQTLSAWMNSPGHRDNLLNCDYDSAGLGLGIGGDYGRYWVLNIGRAANSD